MPMVCPRPKGNSWYRIDGPKSAGAMKWYAGAAACDSQLRIRRTLRASDQVWAGLQRKQAADRADGGRQRDRNRGLRVQRNTALAVHSIGVQLALKCAVDGSRRSAESDKDPAGGDPVNLETIAFEPPGQGMQIAVRKAEAVAHLLRRKPVVIKG